MKAVSPILKKEFEYYLLNQDKFVKEYDGKVIVLKDYEVVGVYDSFGQAYWGAQEKYQLGFFLIQKVSEGTQDTHSSAYGSRRVTAS